MPPLCWCLLRVVDAVPLRGFRLLLPSTGWVNVTYPALGEAGFGGIGHSFFYQEAAEVIACLSFGQFILPYRKDCRPWDRIYYAVSLVPDLIKISGGIALLRGNVEEIRGKLGLEYRLRDRSGEF